MAHIDSYTDRGIPFSAWLYRIAHNLVANWHRDRGRRQIISLEDYVGDGLRGEAPEHQVVTLEEKHALMEAIKRLPEERQQLIILKYVERMSNAEIGTIMDRTEGAVKSLYHRTLLALRRELSSDSDDHEDSSNEESETPPPRWRRFG
jgi:RNA polymerase sigma-70 factor (ECF subfamily)